MLKTTFGRGSVQLIVPGWQHFAWVDIDEVAYDIDGRVDYMELGIPDSFLEEYFPDYLENFKHRSEKGCIVDDHLIDRIRLSYWEHKKRM